VSSTGSVLTFTLKVIHRLLISISLIYPIQAQYFIDISKVKHRSRFGDLEFDGGDADSAAAFD
jgi:hypothetical protein